MVAENQIVKSLLSWWEEHAHSYPWRRRRDPYAILVSEFMLQQTRAQTVIYPYVRFVEKFPNFEALAAAREDQILKACENMGYYRRFQALSSLAKVVVEKYGGRLPADSAALRALPGVGEYTAAAVRCFAFGFPDPAIDGNLKRVLARLKALNLPVEKAEGKRELRKTLLPLLDHRAPSVQSALMDLGQTLCLPRSPKCSLCPLSRDCRGYRLGTPTRFPVQRKRKATQPLQVVAGIAEEGGRILLTKRKSRAFLGGLWEFPGGKVERGETSEEALQREFCEEVNLSVEPLKCLGVVQHQYTRFKVSLRVYTVRVVGGELKPLDCAMARWVKRDRVRRHPLTAGTLKIWKRYLKASRSTDDLGAF